MLTTPRTEAAAEASRDSIVHPRRPVAAAIIRSIINTMQAERIRDGDRQVLAALSEHGADLTKPTHIIHYLYFLSAGAADEAATYLRLNGFHNVRAERSPPINLWERIVGSKTFSCIAEQTAVPSEEHVFRTTDQLRALADQHNGEYDGWEAAIQE